MFSMVWLCKTKTTSQAAAAANDNGRRPQRPGDGSRRDESLGEIEEISDGVAREGGWGKR